jgi:hypothetical protein
MINIDKVSVVLVLRRSSTAAEKNDEGMALKIRTGAEDMPGGFKQIETDTHTKWKRTLKKK